jgi:iron complex outermembrane receptor protein
MALVQSLQSPAWAQPISAAETSSDASEDELKSSASERSKSPQVLARGSLLVQESTPYLPTSNTIATKLPVALDSTPANVGLVGSQLIAEQHALVLGDALSNISGLNVQTGSGVFDFFVVRGFDSLSSSLVLTDGAAEPEVTFYQLYNTEKIEVLKGPAGFLYGSNPLSGAVNIVRKQPIPTDFGVIGVSVGSFGTFEGTVDLNRSNPSNSVDIRLNSMWRESDGYRDGRASEVLAINPAITWRPDERSSLNFNVEYVSSDFTPDAGLPLFGGSLPDIPRDRSYASPFDLSEQDIYRLQVDYDREISGSLSLRNKAYYRQLDWQTDGTLFGFVLPTQNFGFEVTRSLLLLDDRQEFTGNQFELILTPDTKGVSHQILAGLEVARLTDVFSLDVAFIPGIDLFQPVETTTRPFFLIPGQSSTGNSRATVIAPYVVDHMALSEHVQVMLGARFDSIEFDDEVSGSSRSDSEISPMAGIVISPVDNLSIYANAGKSFAPPSSRAPGDQRPEESQQVELGLRRSFKNGKVRATLAAFELKRDNIAIPDDNGFTQQIGDQRSQGIEFETAMDLPHGLHGILSYGYTDSELTRFAESVLVGFFPPTFATLDRSGNRSVFSPEHIMRTWLSKRIGKGTTVGGGFRWVDDQFIAEDNLVSLDDYFLVDALISYDLGNWRCSLNLYNLFDADYETRGFGSASVIPGQPVSGVMSLKYRF